VATRGWRERDFDGLRESTSVASLVVVRTAFVLNRLKVSFALATTAPEVSLTTPTPLPTGAAMAHGEPSSRANKMIPANRRDTRFLMNRLIKPPRKVRSLDFITLSAPSRVG
jgi:hypothetical protein